MNEGVYAVYAVCCLGVGWLWVGNGYRYVWGWKLQGGGEIGHLELSDLYGGWGRGKGGF